LTANRIQFTPDLMPADILGSEVLETGATARAASASSKGRSSASF
jgi:MoxR-like ATPase